MTLLLGIAAPWGMWQSSDHRLMELPSGRVITDSSMKHLGIKAVDGRALVTYTGFGRVDGEDVSDWLRKTLRGEDRGLEDIAQVIADRATRRIGDVALCHSLMHSFVISAFLRGEPFVVVAANSSTPFAPGPPVLRPEFVVTPIRVVAPVPVLAGGGAAAVTREDFQLLRHVSGKKPRRPEEYQALLAQVNRRAAESRHPAARLVSPGSLGSYLPAEDETSQSTFFGERLETTHAIAPFLLRGVDTTEMTDAMPRFGPETRKFVGEWGDQEEALRRSVEGQDD
jgi:hypothetical protein